MITKRDLEKGVLSGADAAANQRLAAMDAAAQKKAEQDAKLTELIKGSQLKTQEAERQRQSDLEDVKSLRQLIGKDAGISAGHVKIDPREAGGFVLTPAEQAAESAGGKKAAEYMTGGRAAADAAMSNLQDVQNQIQGGKRDIYDRVVGGALQNHPSIMGLLAPSEKARADKAHNATLGALKAAGIQRPTQWEVQKVFGHSYDPSSDDATNLARIQAAAKKAAEMRQQSETEVQNLQRTGYVTPGVGGNAPMEPAPVQSPSSPFPSRPPTFEEWKAMKSRGQ